MVHDEVVNFRNADRSEEDKLSIKAKSLGHILRVISGIINLLREAVMKNNDVHGYSFQNLVVKEDFIMAKELVNHSVSPVSPYYVTIIDLQRRNQYYQSKTSQNRRT